MDQRLKGMSSRFHTMKRSAFSNLTVPAIAASGKLSISFKQCPLSDLSTLKKIPAIDVCSKMKSMMSKKNIFAVSCSLGVFCLDGVNQLIDYHNVLDMQKLLKEEKEWFSIPPILPHPSCFDVSSCRSKFENLLLEGKNDFSVLPWSRFLLTCDFSTLACNRWLNYSLMIAFIKLLQTQSEDTCIYYLNDWLADSNFQKTLKNFSFLHQKYVTFIANVGKDDSGVFFSTWTKPGCHWTLIFVDLYDNKFYYCDSLAWGLPVGFLTQLESILFFIRLQLKLPHIPFKGVVEAHNHNSLNRPVRCSPVCPTSCLPNIPLQECTDLCGVVVIILASFSVKCPLTWKNVFLNESSKALPQHLRWLTSPSSHAKFLRLILMSWLYDGAVNMDLLGNDDWTPDSVSFPSDFPNSEIKNEISLNDICLDEPLIDLNLQSPHVNKAVVNEAVPSLPAVCSQNLLQVCNTIKCEPLQQAYESSFALRTHPPTTVDPTCLDLLSVSSSSNHEQPQCAEILTPVGQAHSLCVADQKPTKQADNGSSEEPCAVFIVGQQYSTLEELDKAIESFENLTFCQLWKRDVRTLNSAALRAPNRIAISKKSLKYYSLKLSCKFGGKSAKQKVKKFRVSRSFRQGCPFYVYLTLSEDGQSLCVSKIHNCHNHKLSKRLYEHLPRQRQIRGDVEDMVLSHFEVEGNKKRIQQKIQRFSGQATILKDISNLCYKTKSEFNSNEIPVVAAMLKQNKCVLEIAVDSDNVFKCLFYQDEYMINMYASFPELLMVDATYKLLDSKMPLYVLLVVDGYGLSEIVGIFITAEETEPVIAMAAKYFKTNNPNWTKVSVVLSDKDFVERSVFHSAFPDAALQICLYHTLRTFRREITGEKMGITSGERDVCLGIIEKLVYSSSIENYNKQYDQLKLMCSLSVVSYFDVNWHPIKEQWVQGLRDSVFNLGETTNNRLESINSKLKNVCGRYSSLQLFFKDFSLVLNSLRNERIHARLMAVARPCKTLLACKPDILEYSYIATPYAFNFILQQEVLSANVKVSSSLSSDTFSISSSADANIVTSTTSCTCNFWKKISLPCKHIFHIRKLCLLSMYDATLVSQRWTVKYCDFEDDLPTVEISVNDLSDGMLDTVVHCLPTKPDPKVLSECEKFRKAFAVAKNLASAVCEGGMKTYHARLADMKGLLDDWNRRPATSAQSCSQSTSVSSLVSTTSCISSCTSTTSIVTSSFSTTIPCDPTSPAFPALSGSELKSASCFDTIQLSSIVMPPKMLKRGRPKGAGLTVIGLPKTKMNKGSKAGHRIIPFVKLPAIEKDRLILRCFVDKEIAEVALKGTLIAKKYVIKNVHSVSDMAKNEDELDVLRIERYFSSEAWEAVLYIISAKDHLKWKCPLCVHSIGKKQESIMCDRCLLWFHFQCTLLKNPPKSKFWFCRRCKADSHEK